MATDVTALTVHQGTTAVDGEHGAGPLASTALARPAGQPSTDPL
jgi:hypothetical protein